MQTKVDFEKIKKQLPHGAKTEIAKMANVANSTVLKVLNGESDNIDVLTAIADYLTNLKNKKEATNNRLTSLIN
jgi:predicted transcriptional regulator